MSLSAGESPAVWVTSSGRCVGGWGRSSVLCFCSTGLSGFNKDDDHIRLKAARITFCPVVAFSFLMARSLCKPGSVDHPCRV